MAHYVFPADFMFWTENPKHSEHKTVLAPEIFEHAKQRTTKDVDWLCKVNTEFFDQQMIHSRYESLIKEGIHPALAQMFQEVEGLYVPKNATVQHIWYNRYEAGENNTQEAHVHQGTAYSGIYFLELSEPNNTVFYSYQTAVHNTASYNKTTHFIKEGDILLFPSMLTHYVLPAKNTRTTISFNVVCEFV